MSKLAAKMNTPAFRRIIGAILLLSPFLLAAVLIETSNNDAYPPYADTIAIPLFGYLFFMFPLYMVFASAFKTSNLDQVEHFFWNPERAIKSLLSLVLCVFPLGSFWLNLFVISVRSGSYASALICFIMLTATIILRTCSIQPLKEVAKKSAKEKMLELKRDFGL